ncbi:MAG: hypothetical protein HFF44_06155 [Lawsonibacter sp.]|nr:hypothetical protein [Lawsonibacter sp.]
MPDNGFQLPPDIIQALEKTLWRDGKAIITFTNGTLKVKAENIKLVVARKI